MKTVPVQGSFSNVVVPMSATKAEIECNKEAVRKCHDRYMPRCKATKSSHCCRHWYDYLGMCYAWQWSSCTGCEKFDGVPCPKMGQECPKPPKGYKPLVPEIPDAKKSGSGSGSGSGSAAASGSGSAAADSDSGSGSGSDDDSSASADSEESSGSDDGSGSSRRR